MYFTQHCIILQAGNQFDDQVRDSVFIDCTLIMRCQLIRVCVVCQEALGCDCCPRRNRSEQRGTLNTRQSASVGWGKGAFSSKGKSCVEYEGTVVLFYSK